MVYDDGNPLASTFVDYLVPTASEVPSIDVGHVESRAGNPLGVKGMGEGGAIASPAAVVNAVADALAPLGVKVSGSPLGPKQSSTWLPRPAAERQPGVISRRSRPTLRVR